MLQGVVSHEARERSGWMVVEEMACSLCRCGPPRHFLKEFGLAVSTREGRSLEVLFTPADGRQQLVRSLTDDDLVLFSEVAIDAE